MPEDQELSATVSSKRQVVIPGAVRRRHGLVQGSVLRFVVDVDNSVSPLPVACDLRRLKRRLPTPPQPVSVANMNQAIAEHRARIAAG